MTRRTVHITLVIAVAIGVAVIAIGLLIKLGVEASAAAPITGGVVTAVTAVVGLRKELGIGNLPVYLHHVSLPVRDLQKSIDFYMNALGLHQIPRPPINFGVDGAWFQLPGGQQLHLLVKPNANFRPEATAKIDIWDDCHFALRVPNKREISRRLEARGAFITDHPRVNNERYPHFYTLDPDNHVIEINTEPVPEKK
jgi:catechol 2,3-dioxygenase-like lactoylglutathione lyase family enzyme